MAMIEWQNLEPRVLVIEEMTKRLYQEWKDNVGNRMLEDLADQDADTKEDVMTESFRQYVEMTLTTPLLNRASEMICGDIT